MQRPRGKKEHRPFKVAGEQRVPVDEARLQMLKVKKQVARSIQVGECCCFLNYFLDLSIRKKKLATVCLRNTPQLNTSKKVLSYLISLLSNMRMQ